MADWSWIFFTRIRTRQIKSIPVKILFTAVQNLLPGRIWGTVQRMVVKNFGDP